MKNIIFFLSENFQFLDMKFSIYLNKSVFVMDLDHPEQNIDCGYLLELPRQGGSNKYLQSMFCAEI